MPPKFELVQEINPTAELTHALLLWSAPDRDANTVAHASLKHASLNRIVNGVIQPSVDSLTLAQLRNINSSLQGLADQLAGTRAVTVFPDNLLFYDPHQAITAWWRPGHRASQFFACEELGTIQGIVPMPSLVFRQHHTHLSVCAVAGSERPRADTPVYNAPLFNTYADGGVCLGGVEIEPITDFAMLDRNQTAFLHGINTHPNDNHAKTAYPHGIFALWRDLIAHPSLPWDDDWLVRMTNFKTLGQWLAKE